MADKGTWKKGSKDERIGRDDFHQGAVGQQVETMSIDDSNQAVQSGRGETLREFAGEVHQEGNKDERIGKDDFHQGAVGHQVETMNIDDSNQAVQSGRGETLRELFAGEVHQEGKKHVERSRGVFHQESIGHQEIEAMSIDDQAQSGGRKTLKELFSLVHQEGTEEFAFVGEAEKFSSTSSIEMVSGMEVDERFKEQDQNFHVQTGSTLEIDHSKGAIPKRRPQVKKPDLDLKLAVKVADSSGKRVKVRPEIQKISTTENNLIDANEENLNTRIICAPKLIYSGNCESCVVTPDDRGIWRVKAERKFFKTAEARHWILISFVDENTCDMMKLQYFSECLINSSKKCGMLFNPPIEIKIFDENTSTENAIIFAKNSGAEFAVIVLKLKGGSHYYKNIKYFADLKHSLITQCIEDKNLLRVNDQIATNVCLKINAKLGGINHIIMQKSSLHSKVFILFGAHVNICHGFNSSIAALVGSPTITSAQYSFTCRLQDYKAAGIFQDMIGDMRGMVKELLSTFATGNELPARRIIFFRHGICDGQIHLAASWEIKCIQDACRDLYNEIFPITYIVVKKAHNTAGILPQQFAKKLGKAVNIHPDIIFNSKNITAIQDYFICSQGDKLDSKPTRYIVIHDDSKCSGVDLQEISYYLCYNYACSTQSATFPAPVLYAVAASDRAKLYMEHLKSEGDNKGTTLGVAKAIATMNNLRNNMFYV